MPSPPLSYDPLVAPPQLFRLLDLVLQVPISWPYSAAGTRLSITRQNSVLELTLPHVLNVIVPDPRPIGSSLAECLPFNG